MTSPKELALLLLILLINPQKSLSLSGCDLCASSGDCSQAYLQQPGKFCGTFQQSLTTKPCCCPNYSQCQITSSSCNCYVPPSSQSYHRGHSYHNNDDDDYFDDGAGGSITLVILIFILCCCCGGLCKSNPQSRGPRGEFVPIAVPVGSNNIPDPEGIPPATAPSYQSSTPGFFGSGGGFRGSSGNGGGGFAWGPALGGFLIGEMFGRGEGGHNRHHRHHNRHGGGGWGGGGGGGFTIPGDTGGGRGGGGGFTIPGSS